MAHARSTFSQGFTLIELSIVLVIIGLIVGGILVGRDLIASAEASAQVAQITRYNHAANTFKTKYGYLPGDVPPDVASISGFTPRGIYAGTGDGNGKIEGFSVYAAGNNDGRFGASGEALVFWRDLSDAQLIDGGFTAATATAVPTGLTSSTAMAPYFPSAKLGSGNYVTVNSNLLANYFMVFPAAYASSSGVVYNKSPGLYSTQNTVAQAYAIDKKMDDGLPGSGNVLTVWMAYNAGVLGWVRMTGGMAGTPLYSASIPTTATAASATSCYDNGGVAGTPVYSISYNNGSGMNCSLGYKFQ